MPESITNCPHYKIYVQTTAKFVRKDFLKGIYLDASRRLTNVNRRFDATFRNFFYLVKLSLMSLGKCTITKEHFMFQGDRRLRSGA